MHFCFLLNSLSDLESNMAGACICLSVSCFYLCDRVNGLLKEEGSILHRLNGFCHNTYSITLKL